MPKTVLIVDDSPINRRILKKMLQHDYTILEAQDGNETLALLDARHKDISAVLLDIRMPDIDGFAVLKRLRSDNRLVFIPVIMVTGYDDEDSRIKALSSGANDYVTKPYSPEIIRHCLRTNITFFEASKKLEALQRDRLTGLLNRETFFEKVREMILKHDPGYYVLASFNINRFKAINDQYGTDAGDSVLQHTAQTLSAGFGQCGGVCGRIAGDIFAVLYPKAFTNTLGIVGIRERLIHVDGHIAPLSYRIGRYVVDDLSISPTAMYDRAMLAASSIIGRFDTKIAIYDNSMREQLVREQEIVANMEAALSSRQFEPWFQPQFNHATGAVIGAEALVRWRHPRKGLIPPNDFIPLFEKNGFIYELDKFVWEEVCRLLRKWLDAGRKPLPVSVNISRYDMTRPDLTEVITGLVDKYTLSRDLLRLEITESTFAHSSRQIVNVVKSLIKLGFTVEIDDFGSGYSSLNTLKDVPAQILKLDMKFLEAGDSTDRGGNILESIVRMAKWLDMSVIAEGVETREQADYLQSIGSDYVQGYLYARPMPMEEYEAFCSKNGKAEHLLKLETVANLDNSKFWTPESLDSLIFNSYVGAACIFEYQNNRIEVIRATELFAGMFGSGMRVSDALKLDWSAHLDEENKRLVAETLAQSMRTKKEATAEFVFTDLPGCPKKTYIRATMRVIATTGNRSLVYNLTENETERREAQRKELETAMQLKTMLNDMPGGFAQMQILRSGKLSTVYVNDGLCAMRKMTRAQLMAAERADAMVNVHPDDVPLTMNALQTALATGETIRLQYRLRNGDGAYTWVSILCRITSGQNGETFLNIYYTELTEQEKKDLTIREAVPLILSAIMESSPNLDFAKDRDFKYIFCSPAFARFAGQTGMEGVVGKSDFELFPKETADRFRQDDLKLFESGESLIDYTEPIPSADRVQHYSVTSKYILRDSSGTIMGLYGTGRDVTDTRSALDRLQLLTDSLPGGIAAYAVTPDSVKMTYFNDGLCAMLGCTREEYAAFCANNDVMCLISPDGIAEIKSQIKELLTHGAPIDCTYQHKKLNGSGQVWVHLRGILAERSGDTAFVNAVFFDVTAQKEAEQRERETAERINAIMDNSQDGISAVTVEADGQICFAFANQRYYAILGYTREQFNAEVKNAMNLVFHDDIDRIRTAVNSVIATRKPGFYEYRCTKRDGSLVNLHCRAICTSIAGIGDTVLLSNITDTTEIVKAREKANAVQRTLLDNMPFGAALYAFDGKQLNVLHLNKKYWELVEREPRDASSIDISDAIYPDDRPTLMQEIQTAIQNNRNIDITLRIRCGTENYQPFHTTASVQPKDGGGYLLYAAHERMAPDAFNYQQTLPLLLSAIMDCSNDFTFAKNRDFRYICASRAFLRLAGLDNEREAVGKTDFDLFPADMAKQFRDNDICLLESGRSLVDFDETIHTPDGASHYCRASKYPLLDSTGQIIGLYGVSRDITREHAAFEQLQLINDTVPGGIASYSVKAGVIRITYCNEGFCRLFGGTLDGLAKRGEIEPIDWVVEEDRPGLLTQITSLVRDNKPVDCVFRVRTIGGDIKWLNEKAVMREQYGDTVFFNALLLDVTEREISNERLRISEEENSLALLHGGSLVCRYDVAQKTLSMPSARALAEHLPEVLHNVPDEPVRQGLISPETANAYIGFFEAIQKGNTAGTVLFQQKYKGQWRWEEAKSSTVFAGDGAPIKAVISMNDVTDRIEKEHIYKKWQQSLTDKTLESYTLFCTNLNRRSDYDSKEGCLLAFDFEHAGKNSFEVAHAYAERCVYAEDREKYIAFVNADTMLANYYRGKRSSFLEYRELVSAKNVRWLRLTVDLVEYPYSTDVQAYMMYENIDEAKKAELQLRERSETDPLTGVLNRVTFAANVNRVLAAAEPDTVHALLMMDLDGFKQVNDVFGHGAGDHALIDIGEALRSITRTDDFVARLGGDEFMVFLNNIKNDAAAISKAKQIRSLSRKSFSLEVQLSASVGIALAPRDGADFETLYKNADSALYYVKGSGKDNQALYSENMANEHLEPEPDVYDGGSTVAEKKRRMLIVDDSNIDNLMLENIFKDEFIIEKAKDGNTALIRLRHYGCAISVVLLDLLMPGMDGFGVLEKMQENAALRSIPVIMVSGDDSRESCLAAIRKGATDFVTKPVDADILHIRVHSAVSRAENERLRAKNSLLELQSREQLRYEAYLDSPGTAYIEYDWLQGDFTYYPSISRCLLGTYDNRKLWHILLSDMVADTHTVQDMQQLVHQIAETQNTESASRIVKLKTPRKATHRFRMNVRKLVNEYQLTNRVIITLTDLELFT